MAYYILPELVHQGKAAVLDPARCLDQLDRLVDHNRYQLAQLLLQARRPGQVEDRHWRVGFGVDQLVEQLPLRQAVDAHSLGAL